MSADRWQRTWACLFTAACVTPVLATPAFAQDQPPERPAPITDFDALRRSKVYQAVRVGERITVDGLLSEPGWASALPGGGFVQTDPESGVPPIDSTEFRILFDDAHIYVAVTCWQTSPIVVSGLQRDFSPRDGDQILVLFDTFDDSRSAFIFQTNPGGAQRDQQIAGGTVNANWDGVYLSRARVHGPDEPPGWTAEFGIPFKTLRFDDSRPIQRWGLNFLRINRSRNEWSLWSPGPRPLGVLDVFIAGKLEGIEGIRQGRNLHVKPFVALSRRTGIIAGTLDEREALAGSDLKYGITSRLTLDLTLNTDFSHVEADEQQVNLTRFSLFFPEKREFFLENAGVFDVGMTRGNVGTGPGLGGFTARRELVPFFSRRIGLSPASEPLPISGGARLTGKLAGFDVGLLNMQVASRGDIGADGRTVLRLRRDLLADSDIGGFFFHRAAAEPNDNAVAGFDGNLRLLRRRLALSGLVIRSQGSKEREDALAARFETAYADNFYAVRATYVSIPEHFQNDFGFVPRPGIRSLSGFAAVRPRPRAGKIAEVVPQVELLYTTDPDGLPLTRLQRGGIWINSRDGANVSLFHNRRFERLHQPFRIRTGISIPVGDYDFGSWEVGFASSQGRPVFTSGGLQYGTFWSGSLKEFRLAGGYRHSAHFTAQLTWSRNMVDLADGEFQTDLLGVRTGIAYSAAMALESFIQYNTDSRLLATRFRYRMIHSPLSDLFVVYDEVRGVRGNEGLSRVLSLKVTRLMNY